jgi:hypothetical protein
MSRRGVCPACRREAAPAAISELCSEIAAATAVSGAALVGFAAWQELSPYVLDSDLRRSSAAVLLGALHFGVAFALWQRRLPSTALTCTAVCLLSVTIPILGGEPWWTAPIRIGVSAWMAWKSRQLKVQLDELYLPLDRSG